MGFSHILGLGALDTFFIDFVKHKGSHCVYDAYEVSGLGESESQPLCVYVHTANY